MLSTFVQFAKSQSADELRRQAKLATQMELRRRVLALVPFVVGAVFVHPAICAALAVLDMVLETLALRMLGSTDPVRQPQRYLLTLAVFFASNTAYVLLPALAWQVEDPFSKAFAMGALLVNVVHVATVRTVHFPLAMTDYSAAALITIIANTYYWLAAGNITGLFLSSFCLGPALYFSFSTMLSVHNVHAETNQERQVAEAANAAKTRFMAQMSHELRTPLNAILGMGYAEMTYAGTAEAKERLRTLVDSARSLSTMLDDILDLSSIQAGQLQIRPTVVNLRAEIEQTIDLFPQQLSDSALQFSVNIPPDLPRHVLIDGQRFRQCLANIISNAIKYTVAGKITIQVATFAPNLLRMEISDTGPGVPTHLQERIFEPFYRGETAVAGSGLGLSISRTLARRMGGDLNLLPSTAGALFRLTIAIPAAHPADAPLGAAPVPVNLANKRVLVVDDLATNRLVAVTYLRIMGAWPEAAESGAQALQMIAENPPDVVLLDMLMDGMDGMETFLHIRALPGRVGKTPIIAMTADAAEERRRFCLAAGFDGYLTKPISPELLGKTLQSVVMATSD